MAIGSQQQIDFINQYSSTANQTGQALGIPYQYILSQWALETSWGTQFAGSNNLGNVSPDGQAANYGTIAKGVSAYQSTLQNEGVTNTPTLYDFASALHKGGYATDPNYPNKLQSVFQTVQKDIQAGGGATGAMTTNPAQPISVNPFAAGQAKVAAYASKYGVIMMGVLLILFAVILSQRSGSPIQITSPLK